MDHTPLLIIAGICLTLVLVLLYQKYTKEEASYRVYPAVEKNVFVPNLGDEVMSEGKRYKVINRIVQLTNGNVNFVTIVLGKA